MNLKKMIFVNTIITFGLAFLIHFAYNIFPNPVSAIFFSVNESIWEHMKMLFTTILLYGIIESLLLKKFNIEVNNFMLTTVLKAIIAIPIYLIIFLPLYNLFGESMFIAISVMLISIFLVNLIGYKLLDTYDISNERTIGILLIIVIYGIMAYLTFNPPKTMLFKDTETNSYGIQKK